MSYINQKLRNSARGEECTLEVPSVCNGNPETSVLCHLLKADDYVSCIAYSACHDWLDKRVKGPFQDDMNRQYFMRRAMVRTWRRWVALGLVRFA